VKTPDGDSIGFFIATDCTPQIAQIADAYTTHVTDKSDLVDSGSDLLERFDVGDGPYRDNPLRVDLHEVLSGVPVNQLGNRIQRCGTRSSEF
jgi:hypothetical protein